MDTLPPKSPKIWPLVSVGYALLMLLACGTSAALGMGGALWFTQGSHSAVNQEKAPTAPLSPQVARLTGLLGWVEVQDQGTWATASEGQLVRAGQRVRTGEMSKATLNFYDGSQAWLEAGSELSIDELNADRGNQMRTVVLTQWAGQSEHQVAKNGRQDSRYVVNTAAGSAEAHGTLFRVFVTPAGEARYMVVEGSVAVTSLNVTVLVQTGQVTALYLGQPPLAPVMSVTAQGEVTQTGDTWTIAGQSFLVNEHTVMVGNPQVGDWALVEGRLLDDGSHFADWIILIHASQANHFSLNGEVDTTGETEWAINDKKIYITSDTEIDPGIAAGDLVHVDGLILEDGRLEAASIRLIDSQAGLPFEFTGVIQAMNNDEWLISGQSVRITAETSMPDELAAGELVRVSGHIQEDGTWLASSISRVEQQAGHFEFSGVLENTNPWQVAGIALETRDWTVIAPDLKLGDLVFVEGEIDASGAWVAEEIVRLDAETARLVLIGIVVSKDPWIVSGVNLRVTNDTQILSDISIGSLVRVELVLGQDGQWYAERIELLPDTIVVPGCIDLVATVVSVTGNQIQLENWPLMPLDENAQVEGVISPNSVVRFQLCFNKSGQITIVYIVILEQAEGEPTGEIGGKVLVCHKPDKKNGGHTLSIDAAALPAHLGHGDYAGPCR
jgi:hypothetical protein